MLTPSYGDAASSKLADICAAIGLSLSEAQLLQLLQFAALLERWNKTYQLSTIQGEDAILVRHIADALSVLPFFELRFGSEVLLHDSSFRVLDVGSGGGIPGVVWAIACPQFEVHCVDAVGKKAAFVQHCAAQLNLPNLFAHHKRVESLIVPPFDLVACRAFSSLALFAKLALFHVKQASASDGGSTSSAGLLLAMKAKHPSAELDELVAANLSVKVEAVEAIQVPTLQEDRHLVWIKRV